MEEQQIQKRESRGRPKGTKNKKSAERSEDKKVFESISSTLNKINDKLDRMMGQQLEVKQMGEKSSVVSAVTTNPVPEAKNEFPIPIEYRYITDELLNKDFGIELEMVSDSPMFQFTVVVPEKYSNLSDEYKRMYKRDIRPKMITFAEGAVGVRSWVERVWSSFNPTVQALIVSDKTL